MFDRMGLTMGYRGKVAEREEARALRAHGLTMLEIATKLGVSKSSVSLWTRDVEFVARPRPSRRCGARRRAPNALQRRKAEEIERLNRAAVTRLGVLSDQAFLAAGALSTPGRVAKGTALWSSPTATPHGHVLLPLAAQILRRR
jgi:transcriptional regulator with XRE-family HTH domain